MVLAIGVPLWLGPEKFSKTLRFIAELVHLFYYLNRIVRYQIGIKIENH
jgi:hypothetical protein